MVLWIGMLAGVLELPMAFDDVTWHAHAFLFGYLGAILSGFALTAVPNWTGRLPVVGWRLAALAGLWLMGRVAMLASAVVPAWLVAVLDLASLVLLFAVLLREVVLGRNWRNLIVVAMIAVFVIGGAKFHWDAAQGESAVSASGFRIALAAALMMICVIGGRIIPSFTRNWLATNGQDARPTPPMQRFDKLTLLATLITFGAWVFAPSARSVGGAMLLIAALHVARLARWKGLATLSEPLVWILHVAYFFVPLGAIALGGALLWPDVIAPSAAQHVWMAGAVGLMTLAVMTRATLGHSGRPLKATRGTIAIFVALIMAVCARVFAGMLPDMAQGLYMAAAMLWVAAFLGFVLIYGPMLLRPKRQAKSANT
jgi:uncharacterized protein involved in response to NO